MAEVDIFGVTVVIGWTFPIGSARRGFTAIKTPRVACGLRVLVAICWPLTFSISIGFLGGSRVCSLVV